MWKYEFDSRRGYKHLKILHTNLMGTFKKAVVVIETTKKKSKIAICYNNEKEAFLRESDMQLPNINNGLGVFIGGGRKATYQAMYITTDERITKDDWYLSYINGEFNGVFQADTGIDTCIESRTWREESVKIIATTNSELLEMSTIPTISKIFVKKFIESYNNKNPIREVLVLYNTLKFKLATYGKFKTMNKDVVTTKELLHIDPKDNCITIKKPKNQFSRDEVEALLDKCKEETDMFSVSAFTKEHGKKLSHLELFELWKKENL